MNCNDPILNKYIHSNMHIFVWEKLWKDIHQNVNSGYLGGRILDNLNCLFSYLNVLICLQCLQ